MGFEETLEKAVTEWSKKNTAANFILYTSYGYLDSWSKDVN